MKERIMTKESLGLKFRTTRSCMHQRWWGRYHFYVRAILISSTHGKSVQRLLIYGPSYNIIYCCDPSLVINVLSQKFQVSSRRPDNGDLNSQSFLISCIPHNLTCTLPNKGIDDGMMSSASLFFTFEERAEVEGAEWTLLWQSLHFRIEH